jgi:hypothetical protein
MIRPDGKVFWRKEQRKRSDGTDVCHQYWITPEEFETRKHRGY